MVIARIDINIVLEKYLDDLAVQSFHSFVGRFSHCPQLISVLRFLL